jgi:hypothetical protein
MIVYPCHIDVTYSNASSPQGLSPAQIRSVYNLPSTGGNGTIAIIDAYDDPTILNDTNVFCTQYGLPNLTSVNFEEHMMTSNITFDSGWANETSLDVQWAHAIAPNATILLVEASAAVLWYDNGTVGPLLQAVDYARNQSDVVAISMSWTAPSRSDETNYDSYFNSSFGATFFAASGDHADNASWPAASQNVVSVGGTTLNFNSTGSFANETVWYSGIVNGRPVGTGGGVSQYETEPSYQTSYNLSGANDHRSVPDVSYDADPALNDDFPIYTSFSGNGSWTGEGGTSAGTAQWAAIKSLGLLASNDRFYAIANSPNYSSCFRDITVGSNGNYNATSGYDFCTGLGSPLTTIYHYPPDYPTLSGPPAAGRNMSYTYTTNAVIDPDGGQIQYNLNATGPSMHYQNTTTWVNSSTPMSWNISWGYNDSYGTYLMQTWVDDVYGGLSNTTSLQVTLVVGDINLDGTVNILDAILLANAFGSVPGNSTWNPKADLNNDGTVNILDAIILASNFLLNYTNGSPLGMSGQQAPAGPMTQGGPSILVDPSQVTVFKGDVFTVNVNVTSVTDLLGWEFKLYWNSTALNCTNAAIVTPAIWQGNTQDYDPGSQANYNSTNGVFSKAEAANYPAPSFNGSMTIATLTFQALQPGTSSLTLTDTILGNSTAQSIACSVSSGSVTVYYGRYMRGDTQTINGLNAYSLNIPESTSSTSVTQSGLESAPSWGIRVFVRHSDGTETEVVLDGQTGTPKAVVSGSDMQSANTSVSQTTLQSTDSLVVRVYIWLGADNGWSLCASFTTEQLQASTLQATTWTVFYSVHTTFNRLSGYTGTFYWGNTYNSRIQNLQYA